MAKFKITGLPKAQQGLVVNDPDDPRLKAYNDSLSLYNRFPMPRDKSHFVPFHDKNQKIALAKLFNLNTRILPSGIDAVDAVLRNGLYYHKPIFKKPKLKVTLEDIPKLEIRPLEAAYLEPEEPTPLNLGLPYDNKATTIEAEDVSTKMPIYKNEPVYGQRSDGSWYIKEYKKVIVGYETIGGKNYKRVPFELRPYQEGGQLQPGYYKYKHKPEASYKFDGNQWYISNEGTKGNYKPIEDPKGTRSKTLAKGLEYGTTQFYAPLAENVQGQTTTFPQVSQKSIQAAQQNLDAEEATQQQAVDNLNEYYNRKRNQTSYNIHDLPEEKGWYYNEGETLKGVADDYLGDTDTQVDKATALSGDAEAAVEYIMSDPNYGLPNNSQGLRMARDMVKNWTPQQIEQFVTERREAYMESQRGEIRTPSKSTVSFDAPENPTLADYAGRIWDIATHPIDAFNYSVATGDVSNMPWNMRQYENAKAALGEKDFTDDNLVGSAVDALSYFTPAGLVAHGIKSLPETNEAIQKFIANPTWETGSTAGLNLVSNIMELSPLGRFTPRGVIPRNLGTSIKNASFEVPSKMDLLDMGLNLDPRLQQSELSTAINTVSMARDLRPNRKTIDGSSNTEVNALPKLNIRWPWSKPDIQAPDLDTKIELLDLLDRNRNFALDPMSPKVEFDRIKAERLADYDTPEGRRRIQKHIDDNKIEVPRFDPGNSYDIEDAYTRRMVDNIMKGNYEKEDYELLDNLKRWGKLEKNLGKYPADVFTHSAGILGNKTWDELDLDDLAQMGNTFDLMKVVNKAASGNPNNTLKQWSDKVSVDEYIDAMRSIEYSPDALTQQARLDDVTQNQIPYALSKYHAELAKYQHMQSEPHHYTQQEIDEQENVILPTLEKELNDLKDEEVAITNEFPRDNAGYSPPLKQIYIGRGLQTQKDLRGTMAHEWQHAVDLRLKHLMEGKDPNFTNTKINKELIKDIKLAKHAPERYRKKIDKSDLTMTSGANAAVFGINKAYDPQAFFNNAKDYWSKGKFSVAGHSNEPVAFLAEVREAMLMDGMIKNIYDEITPEMLKDYYKAYNQKPLVEEDLRIFDIMENSNSNFRSLSKHMNNLQALVPYLIGAGGVGTMLSGAGEEEEPEMQMGGIIMDLRKDEIEDYINRGYIVVEE